MIDRPHEVDQLVVDDLDDLLAGIEGAQDVLAERFLGDALDEVVGDGEIDVGVEQARRTPAMPSRTLASVIRPGRAAS